MLRAYTVNGAWAAGDETRTGTIEPGKAADLVVLDRDLTAVAPHEVARARVLLTLLDGRAVFRDRALAP
jgi:predicted amidohydrolase YtcJ